MNENREPFYKVLFNDVRNEIGPIDTITGLALGVVICGLYWAHCYKHH